MTGRTLYRNGAIYSTHDPFATAMLVEDDTIAWLGSDEAATGVAGTATAGTGGSGVRVVDLRGALITPALHDSSARLDGTDELAGADGTDDGESALRAAAAAGYVALTGLVPAGGHATGDAGSCTGESNPAPPSAPDPVDDSTTTRRTPSPPWGPSPALRTELTRTGRRTGRSKRSSYSAK